MKKRPINLMTPPFKKYVHFLFLERSFTGGEMRLSLGNYQVRLITKNLFSSTVMTVLYSYL